MQTVYLQTSILQSIEDGWCKTVFQLNAEFRHSEVLDQHWLRDVTHTATPLPLSLSGASSPSALLSNSCLKHTTSFVPVSVAELEIQPERCNTHSVKDEAAVLSRPVHVGFTPTHTNSYNYSWIWRCATTGSMSENKGCKLYISGADVTVFVPLAELWACWHCRMTLDMTDARWWFLTLLISKNWCRVSAKAQTTTFRAHLSEQDRPSGVCGLFAAHVAAAEMKQ